MTGLSLRQKSQPFPRPLSWRGDRGQDGRVMTKGPSRRLSQDRDRQLFMARKKASFLAQNAEDNRVSDNLSTFLALKLHIIS